MSYSWEPEVDETSAPKLPPFGIVDLNGPSEHPGLLHISIPQYNSTIKSYPDAALTYLDDDDGETITVGSGYELQQRLEEPIRHSRSLSLQSILQLQRDCDQRIHLFDIKHSANSRAVWNEHAAYSSKTLREYYSPSSESSSGKPSSLSPSTDQIAHDQLAPTLNSALVAYPLLSVQQAEPIMDSTESQHGVQVSTEPEFPPQVPHVPSTSTPVRPASDPLREFVEMHVDTFAAFLDSAAGVLQTVAQKTRDADTSPVESMLTGMKEILSEVGQLGMEVLNGLEYEHIPAEKQANPVSLPKVEDDRVEKQEEVSDPQPKVEAVQTENQEESSEIIQRIPTLNKRVSFAREEPKEKTTSVGAQAARKALADQLMAQSKVEAEERTDDQAKLQHLLGRYSKVAAGESTPIFPGLHLPSGSYQNFPNRPGPTFRLPQQPPPPPTSIMDLETSNPDFAARYPPLMSLRRAKTVSDLHKGKQNGPESFNTKGALHRYPSIGQLEAQRKKPYDIHHKKRGMPPLETTRKEPRNDISVPTLVSPVSPIATEPISTLKAPTPGYKSPTVEDELAEQVPKISTKPRNIDYGNVPKPMPRTLPGSWPEPKPEDLSALPISNESSGAFFNRMTGIKQPERLPKRSVSPALSCRNTSPPADPFWPSGNLRRAHTVTASNPAARLTRPFDPMCGAPNPLFPRGDGPSAPLSDYHQPKRSLTQREPPRPLRPSNRSTFGGPNAWNFPPPAQAPMMMQPLPPQAFAQQFQAIPTNFHGPPTLGDFMRPQGKPVSPPISTRNGQAGGFPPLPTQTWKVEDCIKALQQMGYGSSDPNEAARLNVYAGAAAGDVMEAMDMIEEDRQVAAAMKSVNGSIRTL